LELFQALSAHNKHMRLPKKVKIVEVGPRDGLQNESEIVPTDVKISFINELSQTGLQNIEATSFVSPRWVPQMADHLKIMRKITRFPNVSYSVLVPNEQGIMSAIEEKANSAAVFTAASETFTQKNIHCTIEQSLEHFKKVVAIAQSENIPVRGYISCALGCPFEGKIASEKVVSIAESLMQMGCNEISIGDTIGVGTPVTVQELIKKLLKKIPPENIAVHFHDTYGLALANIFAALELGIQVIDSSVAGLGGCPYAPGAGGNVASEDVVNMLSQLNIQHDINLNKLIAAGNHICDYLEIPNRSKVSLAMKLQ